MPYTETVYTDGGGPPISDANLNKSESALKISYDHTEATDNPHGTTKTHLGLDNVDNTSDANKPISDAQAIEFDKKQNILVSGTNIKTVGGVDILGSGDIPLVSSIATEDETQYLSQNVYVPENSISTRTINPSYSMGMFLYITKDITIDALTIKCTASGTSVGTIVLYKMDGFVGTKIVETGTVALDTVAIIAGAITPVLIKKGLYFITGSFDGTGSVSSTSSTYTIPLSRYFGIDFSNAPGGFITTVSTGHPEILDLITQSSYNSGTYACGIKVQ